jgi:hypothetical protein
VLDGEVNCCGTARIVSDGDDLLQAQAADYRLEITELLLETLARVSGFVRCTKAEESNATTRLPPATRCGIRSP